MAQIQNHTSGRAVANIKALQKLPSTHRHTNKMVLVSCPFPNWILCLVEYSVLTMNIRKKDANKTPYFCLNKANFKILQKFSFSHKDTYAVILVSCSCPSQMFCSSLPANRKLYFSMSEAKLKTFQVWTPSYENTYEMILVIWSYPKEISVWLIIQFWLNMQRIRTQIQNHISEWMTQNWIFFRN